MRQLVRLTHHRSRFAQSKTHLPEQALALAHAQFNSVVPTQVLPNELPIPHRLSEPELPRWSPKVPPKLLPLLLTDPSGSSSSFSFAQPLEPVALKAVHPPLDCATLLAEHFSHLRAGVPFAHQQQSVQPVIVARLLRSTDFLLNRYAHNVRVGNLQFLHRDIYPQDGGFQYSIYATLFMSLCLAPLEAMRNRYGFSPPQEKGLTTVETCQGVLDRTVQAFVGLGGNFIRAVPETALLEKAWEELELTVQIATKLNRSHLVHGKTAYLLPCRGRIEIDTQSSGPQSVTTEDSTGYMHPSRGTAEPASPHLLSEPAIVAGMAKATLPASSAIDWDGWVADYARIRDEIAAVLPEIFHDFNIRREIPGGFRRPVAAAHRQWQTRNAKANFITPESMVEDPDASEDSPDMLRLMTLRSDDQFNTTVYTLNDRFRGVKGTRKVLFLNA